MIVNGEVEEGMMMGYFCLCIGGQFFVMIFGECEEVVVKFFKDWVIDLIWEEIGLFFVFVGWKFKEWVVLFKVQFWCWCCFIVEVKVFVEGLM